MKQLPKDHEVFVVIGQPNKETLPEEFKGFLKQERVIAQDRMHAISLVLLADPAFNPIAVLSLQDLKTQVKMLEACQNGRLPALYASEFLDEYFWESIEEIKGNNPD